MRSTWRRWTVACTIASGVWGTVGIQLATAAPPPIEQALGLNSIQRDVEYDRPAAADIPKCTIQAENVGQSKGWVVRSPAGQTLRKFVDTNGDNVVDLWCYYQDGLEVYRDIDTDNNGKADQYRWLNTAGCRWGLDSNEDGKIDSWKQISAEEVSAEVIGAIVARDAARFSNVLLTAAELAELGLSPERVTEVKAKLDAAPTAFNEALRAQKLVPAKSQWVQFGAGRPGIVPAGTDGSTKDILVYENVVAVIDSEGKHGQVPIGTLIQVGNNWRLLGAPDLAAEEGLADSGLFFRVVPNVPAPAADGQTPGAPDKATQDLLAKLEEVDKASAKAANPEEEARFNAQRADILGQLAAGAATDADRAQWCRQLADTVSAAVQSNALPDGVDRLAALFEQLKTKGADAELLAYVKFRQLTADYSRSLQASDADFAKVQDKWLADLQQFVADFPKSPDTAEAMLQLAIAKEFAGEEDQAKTFYAKIATDFGDSSSAAKAAGAKARLESVGKPLVLRGADLQGRKFDIGQFRGKVVLVQYWATWCEPAKADMALLKELQAKYAKSGFTVIGVNLDNQRASLDEFLKTNRLPWLQIFEPGGLDGRLANEMGILTLPTMLLIDEKGNVVDRNIHVSQLDTELKKRLK
ncbi:MAG: redoxin family protein [Pirellulales bacterium]|nr:redoxin family protein [Pirellulales bacterium]